MVSRSKLQLKKEAFEIKRVRCEPVINEFLSNDSKTSHTYALKMNRVYFSGQRLNFKLSLYLFLRTPLHYAAAHCHFQNVLILLTAGGDVNVTDSRGCTPLHYAAANDVDAK